jgi:phosphate transport system protein
MPARMSTRLEESLERDLDHIRLLMSKMAELAVRTLRDCVLACEERDRELCQIIILRDQRIDQMEKELDRLCLEFLLRHQPAGRHLRFASAVLRISFQLERVGDYAESIARQALKLLDFSCQIPARMLKDISSASISMLHNSVTAFVRQDSDLAGATAQIEEQVDVLRSQVNNELTHMAQTNQLPYAALTPLMTIARRFERVSDQAKAICQETLYICTGEYAKHQGSHVYRVLFVDDHHGCLSRMAEAIGQALHRPEFQFSSAGLDPAPIEPALAGRLRERGLMISKQEPAKVPDVPEFHRYQIVVPLSAAARQQLPAPFRKNFQFQWAVEDPRACAGTAEEMDAAYERACKTLTAKVSGLAAAILAEDQGGQVEIPR